MRLMKGKFFAMVALLLGGASGWFLFFRPEKPSVTLGDGTILTLEKVNYGQKQNFVLNPWRYRLQKVIDHLPAWLSRKLPRVYGWPASWGGGQLPLPNDDALYVWLTRRDPHSGHNVDTDVHWAEIVDEHGCPFIAAHIGGMTYHRGQGVKGYEVGCVAFQAFPRRQKQFRLRLYDRLKKLLGELTVSNPAA